MGADIARGVDDHRDLAGGLELAGQCFDKPGVVGRVDIGCQNADDIAVFIDQAACQVIDVIPKRFGRFENFAARVR